MREWSSDGSPVLAQPANGGARDAAQGLERRRPQPVDQPPLEMLRQMPSLVLLERLPEPALAVDRDGTILFANGAFCDMLGHAPDKLLAMNFGDIFGDPATHQCAVDLIHAHRDRLVTLAHKDGHPVRARMSKSAIRRRDDGFALVIIQDHTEELWLNSSRHVQR